MPSSPATTASMGRTLIMNTAATLLCVLMISSASTNPIPGNEFIDIGLTLGRSSHLRQHAAYDIIGRATKDEIGDDFQLTEQTINAAEATLVEFVNREIKDNPLMATPHPILGWLARQSGSLGKLADDFYSKEMDFVYANFWTHLKPLITSIIIEKPLNTPMIALSDDGSVQAVNLAFRCDRTEELKILHELGRHSVIFEKIVDIFASDLYNHCLQSKLVMIRMNQIMPSFIVRQIVEIYLANRTSSSAGEDESKFDLMSATGLVLDLMSSYMSTEKERAAKVERFKMECNGHAERLNKVWANFDQVAQFLSSSMINLQDYNEKIKRLAPQLVYATVCSRLAQR